MKVLIIEDNFDLAENMLNYLRHEGNICESASNFVEGQDKLASFEYDCIILDIMLPDGNGLALLEEIKSRNIKSGILIISAKNALQDKVDGLNLGADDYLTKPFHLPELNARLQALYRRKKLEGDMFIKFNEILINTDNHVATVHKEILDLTKKEFYLLLYFLTNKNRVLTKQSIAEHLWGDFTDNMDNFDFVYQHVKNLRKKIQLAKGNDYISTVYGLGYRFNTNVS